MPAETFKVETPSANTGFVRLTHAASGSTAEIYLTGATLTSWRPAIDGKERIYMSPKAVINGTKAIRGGIPIAWPFFGPKPETGMPQHGFVRVSQWKWNGLIVENDEVLEVSFSLVPENVSQEFRALFLKAFALDYRVYLRGNDKLETKLIVQNPEGSEPLAFTTLLHTYFRIGDLYKAQVRGLIGLSYADKVAGERADFEDPASRPFIEIDRVYREAPNPVLLDTAGVLGWIRLTRENLPDVVVWNPAEKAGAMADLGADQATEFVCVEAGRVEREVVLQAGETWSGSQVLKAELS
ncbi:galactose mutarotase-like domain-containing protein [Hyaloraphidium curvatum]|nr:galactose mutarotase-like domain-containing protein [Hyaloraphidium curvatum]